jgi:hypothetical protein
MICNECAAGSGSNTQWVPEGGPAPAGVLCSVQISHNEFNGTDGVVEDIIDAATR